MTEFAARLFGSWVRGVDRKTLRADLLAGILGALLVLPQGIAFATLAGLPPEYGLYTADRAVRRRGAVRLELARRLRADQRELARPVRDARAARARRLARYIALALAVTVLVGTMQFLIGALRLGTIANFISPAALRGFIGGAAALIVVYALPDLLGLPAPAAHRLVALAEHLGTHLDRVAPPRSPSACSRSPASLASKRWLPRLPYMLLALLAATALAFAIDRLSGGVQKVAVVGPIPAIWPHLTCRRSTCASFPTWSASPSR